MRLPVNHTAGNRRTIPVAANRIVAGCMVCWPPYSIVTMLLNAEQKSRADSEIILTIFFVKKTKAIIFIYPY